MSKWIGVIAFVFLVNGTASSAHAGSWCAFYDASTYNCGFHSYAQCYQTIFGNGGWCRPNFFEGNGQTNGRRTRRDRY